MSRLKDAYESAAVGDGFPALVERFWPWDLDNQGVDLQSEVLIVSANARMRCERGRHEGRSCLSVCIRRGQ
jgi:hypothetical protein